MTRLIMAIFVVAAWAVVGPAAADDQYSDHKIQGFSADILRTYDPVERVAETPIHTRDIPISNGVVRLRSVDELVCIETSTEPLEEVCVLSSDIQPCLCDYAAAEISRNQSDLGGLSGVVTPNGGTCSCP